MNITLPTVALLLMLGIAAPAQDAARPQPVAVTERASFAEREAASPDQGKFEGGDVVIGLGGLIVLVVLVYLIWYVITDGGRR